MALETKHTMVFDEFTGRLLSLLAMQHGKTKTQVLTDLINEKAFLTLPDSAIIFGFTPKKEIIFKTNENSIIDEVQK